MKIGFDDVKGREIRLGDMFLGDEFGEIMIVTYSGGEIGAAPLHEIHSFDMLEPPYASVIWSAIQVVGNIFEPDYSTLRSRLGIQDIFKYLDEPSNTEQQA